jgi:hypothetical protein
MTLDRGGYLDAIDAICRSAVRDRKNGDDFASPDHLLRDYDSAGAVFPAFFRAPTMFRCPKVRVTSD